jgi:hypothetical protein
MLFCTDKTQKVLERTSGLRAIAFSARRQYQTRLFGCGFGSCMWGWRLAGGALLHPIFPYQSGLRLQALPSPRCRLWSWR